MEISPANPPLRILVVDDELAVRQILADFLESEGHSAAVAVDGREGLEIFHREKWDMVFTDRAMPGMTGDELAAAIKEADPTVPVVMITGFVDPKRDYQAEPRLIDVVVRKPFTFAGLRNAISEACAACR